MRKTIAIAASAVMMLSNVVVVSAATNVNDIVNSGYNLDVNSSSTQTNVVTVNNTNTAVISQTDISSNNTGDNTSKGNIDLCGTCGAGGSSIVTGNAGSVSNMDVNVNSNSTAVTLPSGSGSSTNNAVITNTGKHADFNLSANTTNVVTVNNNNDARINQTSISDNNTGDNYSGKNIGSAGIMTGDALSESNMSATGNSNATLVGGEVGLGSCDTCVGNYNNITNTGYNLDVNSSTNDVNVIGVNNYNGLWVSQTVLASNNTGDNRSKYNIGNGGILTGNAGSLSNMAAGGNSNATVVGFDGLPMGANWNQVVNTGANGDLNLSANTVSVATTSNTNALTDVQFALASNQSGYNYQYHNIGFWGTMTGNAGTGNNFSVWGNSNNTLIGGMWGLLAWLAWL